MGDDVWESGEPSSSSSRAAETVGGVILSADALVRCNSVSIDIINNSLIALSEFELYQNTDIVNTLSQCQYW